MGTKAFQHSKSLAPFGLRYYSAASAELLIMGVYGIGEATSPVGALPVKGHGSFIAPCALSACGFPFPSIQFAVSEIDHCPQ